MKIGRWIGENGEEGMREDRMGQGEFYESHQAILRSYFWWVTTLNDGISQIPEMIAESLSGLSGWLLGSPEDDRITSALKERIPEVWKFKIEGILKVLDSQGFDNLWGFPVVRSLFG